MASMATVSLLDLSAFTDDATIARTDHSAMILQTEATDQEPILPTNIDDTTPDSSETMVNVASLPAAAR